jgi:glyoxylase-like metal-dependent hydrolase (beta-lactamase superfamily II)
VRRAWIAAPIVACTILSTPAAAQKLRLVQFSSDSTSYHVGSTLILGPTEAILVDAQYHMSDARREADSIARLGTHLKAIFITHPDEDHYLGAAAFVERFPGTPVYMTSRGIWEFRRTARSFLDDLKKNQPAEAPDSLVRPKVLPDTLLTVDGERVEIVPDLQGDVLAVCNSVVWIPSLRAVLAGDIVFNRVHPWLAASDARARAQWHQAIKRIADLHPRTVIAAHKSSLDAPDTPDVLTAMDQYLTDFDAALKTAPSPDSVIAVVKRKHPDYAVPLLLQASARTAWFVWRAPPQ